MTSNKTCSIKLLNKTYDMKCPEGEEENLLLAAAKLNKKMTTNKNKFKNLDHFHILLLAALDISYELIRSKTEQEQQRYQVSELISSLENKINKTKIGALTQSQTD